MVFAIGALDAFLHDLVLEIVPAFGPNSQDLTASMREIAKQDPSLALRVALKPDAARQEFQAALDEWLSARSFQGPEAVVRAASYVGVAWSWHELDESLGADTAAELAKFTGMRHDIIHRGRKPDVGRGRAEWCLNLVDAIAAALNGEAVKLYNA